jgi:hypothetical protein
MKAIKIITILTFFSLLQACATGGFLPGSKTQFSQSENAAFITVMREWKFAGGGATHSLSLDGKKIVGVQNGTAYTFPVSPGKHYVKYDKFLETVVAKPGQRYFFKFKIVVFGPRSPAYLEQMSYEDGLKEFTTADYTKVTYDPNHDYSKEAGDEE